MRDLDKSQSRRLKEEGSIRDLIKEFEILGEEIKMTKIEQKRLKRNIRELKEKTEKKEDVFYINQFELGRIKNIVKVK